VRARTRACVTGFTSTTTWCEEKMYHYIHTPLFCGCDVLYCWVKIILHFNWCRLSLQGSYRQFHEMAEALAERLLDLHCRLLSLYVLQDADCLNWEDPHPFFEGERGSFVIQMWWLYMQGNNKCFEIQIVFGSTRYLPCSEICRMYYYTHTDSV